LTWRCHWDRHQFFWRGLHQNASVGGGRRAAVVPIMVVMMLLVAKLTVMGPFVAKRRLRALGWLATGHGAAVTASFYPSKDFVETNAACRVSRIRATHAPPTCVVVRCPVKLWPETREAARYLTEESHGSITMKGESEI
jgi:hypothetical protein